ncbi:ParB/RepB/Spo0J family partition protein [Paracoccus sp. p3-h83]|uniref:ParB/RepB/Spo0J family partition protein n=1 Tax=Paracoccus sp. p3-h83 TaxID=3342805 RepID=UPI0035BB7359
MTTDKTPERKGLGRGLSALMADIGPLDNARPRRSDQVMAIEKIHPNPDQPRRTFAAEPLEELSRSIREKGIIQPLIVRPDPNRPGQYQIVAGERRWRAAQQAQLHEVPVIIRDFDDTEVLEVAIIENIQRADLNPLEEAQGYRTLMDRFGHTQEKVAQALSKSRSHVANLLRLLTLPDEVQTMLRDGKLTAGHARALVTADAPADLARQVAARAMSVRETEDLVRRAKTPGDQARSRPAQPEKDADTAALERDLSATLGMSVKIEHKGLDGGYVSIRYRDLHQLDRICQALGGF